MLDKVRKIGIFGGTLNPVHNGHLIAAEAVREKFCLDRVLFIPAGNPPHKTEGEVIDANHRFNMVKIAVETNPYFEASREEIDREGYTYTVDTLTSLSEEYGKEVELYFIIGADVVTELTTWKDFRKVFSMCSFIAVTRPRYDEEAFDRQVKDLKKQHQVKIMAVKTPLVDISSTDIRDRVKAGRSVKYLVPQSVEEYILKNRLYR